MQSSTPEWMNLLPVSAQTLSFNELRNFKDFHKLINCSDLAPGIPKNVKYTFQSFRFLYFFAVTLIEEKRFPALNRCWDDLRERYGDEFIFEDGIAAETWIFFNFPITKDGRTVLDEFEDSFIKSGEGLTHLQPFIDTAKKSRLGLYQEVLSTTKITKFRELFTDEVISTLRSVSEYEHGEIFLGRIIEINGDRFLFGDPSCFPAERKEELITMVEDKMMIYEFEDDHDGYEKFMRLAGPYWMSVVSDDKDGEILMPDHWMTYHE